MKAILTVGVSASGKSTFAKHWVEESPMNRVELNRDTIRQQLVEADGKEWCWDNWKWKREKEVTAIIEPQLGFCAKIGFDIIISDTNLDVERNKTLKAKLVSLGYEVEFKVFDITFEEAIKRDNKRANGVGYSVLATQYEKYLKLIGRKKYVPDTNKPKAILVDIDGTAAHSNGARGMFEWHNVKIDTPDEYVKMIVNSLPEDVHIIFVSGRDEVCRELTQKWLETHSFRNDGLFMREANNMEKDTVIKERIFWKYIASNYNVLFCIDDRPCVVRLYQELGLKTFIVGNPWIEF
jgi:predicted kinase